MRWTFGAEPLPQVATAAALLRRVAAWCSRWSTTSPRSTAWWTSSARAEAALLRRVPPDPSPGSAPRTSTDGAPYLDHARDIGAYNPCFPEYEIEVDAQRAAGAVVFPVAYEGPPGVVHGGVRRHVLRLRRAAPQL